MRRYTLILALILSASGCRSAGYTDNPSPDGPSRKARNTADVSIEVPPTDAKKTKVVIKFSSEF